jgi:hypothetical protein
MEFLHYIASDIYVWVNVTVFVSIVVFAVHGGGVVCMGMAIFYGAYLAVDVFYLWHEFTSSWMHARAKFSSLMYLAVSVVCVMVMLFFFVNALLRGHQARVSFVLSAWIGGYYLISNLIQAGVIEYTADLMLLYEYIYEYSVFVDMAFVMAGWLSLRGGDEMAYHGRHSH